MLDDRRSLADALREKRGEGNLCIQGVDGLLNRVFRLLRNGPKEGNTAYKRNLPIA